MYPIVFLGLGYFFLILGIVGIILPILPTTPFLILAAACFSKGSPRLHSWMLNHPLFGPPLKDWEEKGAIRRKYKIVAVSMIWISISFPIFFKDFHFFLKTIVVLVGMSLSYFILSRPEK